jgi:hypothetical protein
MRAATSIQSGEFLDQLLAAPNVPETIPIRVADTTPTHQHVTLLDGNNVWYARASALESHHTIVVDSGACRVYGAPPS